MSDTEREEIDLLTRARAARMGNPIDIAIEMTDICDELVSHVDRLCNIIAEAESALRQNDIEAARKVLGDAKKTLV